MVKEPGLRVILRTIFRIGLEEGPEAYKTFRDKKDGCIKVAIKP